MAGCPPLHALVLLLHDTRRHHHRRPLPLCPARRISSWHPYLRRRSHLNRSGSPARPSCVSTALYSPLSIPISRSRSSTSNCSTRTINVVSCFSYENAGSTPHVPGTRCWVKKLKPPSRKRSAL